MIGFELARDGPAPDANQPPDLGALNPLQWQSPPAVSDPARKPRGCFEGPGRLQSLVSIVIVIEIIIEIVILISPAARLVVRCQTVNAQRLQFIGRESDTTLPPDGLLNSSEHLTNVGLLAPS